MSAIRNPATITSVGRRMMTAGGDITYTKAVLYGQDISHLTKEQVEGLTSIGDPLVTVPIGISDKNDDGNGTTVVLEATFQNSNLKADLPYKAVGFFAKKDDGDEKLVLVGVATDGAYLAATSPDGVSTDSLDIKIAVAVGDASNVTAVVDPAGSVTPATLNGAISKATHDLTDKINTKADKTDLDSQIGIVTKSVSDLSDTVKANKDDTDKALDKKADTSDVDAKIKVVTDLTNTKANTVDVDSKIKTVTDLANTKANSADVYTKTETDNQINKFDLSKVKFRKQFLNSDGDKVDKTWSATKNDDGTYTIDLYNDDWTASKLADVLAQLPNKVDTSTVNAQIADTKNAIKSNTDKLQSAINTKANASDVYTKKQVDDAFSSRDATIATKADKATVDAEIAKIDFTPYAKTVDVDSKLSGYTSTADLTKLLNAKANTVDVYSRSELDKKLLEMSADTDGKVNADQVANMIAGKADKTAVDAELAKKDDITDVDAKINSNVTKLNQAINTKANSSDVYVRKDVDSAFSEVRDRIGKLEGSQTVDSPDFNNLTDTGVYYVSDSKYKGMTNGPTGSWGNLLVSNGNGHRISQLYFPDDGSAPFMRELDESTWHNWIQLSTKQDVNNATNAANAASNKIDTVLANSYVRKQGMNANGDCVEIKHTGIKQANGGYAFDMWSDDWTASKLQDVIKNQLPSKADKSQVNVSGNLFNRMTDDSTWKAITGVDNIDNAILTSIRDDSPSGGNTTGSNGSAIAFGGGDTKAVLSVNWLQHEAKITSGNGSGPKWVEDVAWKSDINNTNANVTKAQSTADSANTNANGRLSKAGDTMNTKAVIQWNGGGIDDKTGNLGGMNWSGGTDWAEIYGDQDNNDNLDLAFDLGDDGSNHFSFRKNGTETSAITSDGHYTGTVDWGHVNGRPDVATKADVNSTNATITGLQTQVNNQANEIKQLQETTIKGKTFSKSQEAAAEAWEKQNSQQIAFILDN